MDFLDVHTHKTAQKIGIKCIQSLSLTSDIFLAMPKTKSISIGLHPWFATIDNLETQIKYLQVLSKQSNVKLIGECGLDKLRGESISNQIIILEQQIKIAEVLNKPLILHCVKAFNELIEIKKRLNVKVPMIIHGFNKNVQLGKQMLDKDFILSFGADVLNENSNASKLVQVTDNFLLETDDSESTIEEIYNAVANLKNCSVEILKECIFANWKKLNLL
jgi:TatD DNase family protein